MQEKVKIVKRMVKNDGNLSRRVLDLKVAADLGRAFTERK